MAGKTQAPEATGFRVPTVGRKQELTELHQVLEQAIQYQSPLAVTLVGGHGVGKSRLIEHWTAEVREQHMDVRVFSARALAEDPSYALFTRLLRHRFELQDSAEDQAESFRAQVEEVLQDRRVAEMLHFLGTFLGINVPDSPFIRAMEDSTVQHDQVARTVLRRFIEQDATMSPVVIVLEDLHHADDASLALYMELVENLEGAPLVLLGTCQPELYVRQPDFGELEGEHQRMDLAVLGLDRSEELLRLLLREVKVIPGQLMDTVVKLSGGNPLFIKQLVRIMLDQGVIRVDGDKLHLDQQRLGEVDLPLTVEQAARARVALLSAAERDVLEKASTLGNVFWLEALVCFSRFQQEVEQKSDLWMADVLNSTIKEILEDLAQRDYLLRMPDSSIPGATEFVFKHNMEREQIFAMVHPERMRQYHLFAAQWLETKLPDRSEAQLEYLGRHYEKGGNLRRAAFCYVHAGDKSRARYANSQAADYYRRGLGLLKVDDALSKIEALHNLGDVCTVLGNHQEAMQHFEAMLHYAWLLDHHGKGGAAHRRIGRIHRTLGDYDAAINHLNIAMRLFEGASDSRGVAATLDDVGKVGWLRGEYDKALEFHRQALDIKREAADPRAIAVSLNNIGMVHQDSGSFKAALDCFVEALEIRKDVNDQLGVVDSLTNLGGVHRAQSEYSRAFELWTEALELAQEIGDRLAEAYLRIALAEAQLQLGKPKDADAHLDQASDLADDLGDRRLMADGFRTRCEVRLAMGDLAGAEESAQEALEISEDLGLKPEQGSALRALADVVAAGEMSTDNRRRAVDLYQRAISVFSDLGNDLELARTFASFADYCDRCGNWEDAHHFRESADDIFRRLK